MRVGKTLNSLQLRFSIIVQTTCLMRFSDSYCIVENYKNLHGGVFVCPRLSNQRLHAIMNIIQVDKNFILVPTTRSKFTGY